MLYRTLQRLIAMGQIKNMSEKLDIFFAAGKLTSKEYSELTAQLEQVNDRS